MTPTPRALGSRSPTRPATTSSTSTGGPSSPARPPHGSATDFASHLRVELEADLFAAHLLMPADLVRKRARGVVLGLGGVLELAESFGTSRTSMAVRVAQLDLVPCVAVRWRTDGTAWASVSPSLRALELRAPVAVAVDVPRGGATDVVLRSGRSDSVLETGATSGHWFERVRHGGPRDRLLREEAIGLGPHGALTFLSLLE